MTRLIWDARDYESGVENGVFYPQVGSGEAWNGLVSVKESPSESDESSIYVDGVKISNRRPAGHFSGEIEAFAYPRSFYDDVLTLRRAKPFGMSYKVRSKIHLVYNVLVGPSPYLYRTNGADTHVWPFTTRPIPIPESALSAHIVIDVDQAYSWTIEALEEILYGNSANGARLPTPQEIYDIFEENAILRVTDHGDGTFTIDGPDNAITMIDATTFEVTWPSVVYIDAVTYSIQSL